MPLAALAFSALLPFGLPAVHLPSPPKVHVPFVHAAPEVFHRYGVEGWVLVSRTDRFTGVTRCVLTTKKPRTSAYVRYVAGALEFRFPERLNTLEAWYKVDDGPARPWQADYPTLVSTGVQLEGDSLDNPTGGQVIIPVSMLSGARAVTIQPAPRAASRTFRLGGFADALAAARANGCRPDAAFVR